MTDSPITVDCKNTATRCDFDYDLDNTLYNLLYDLQLCEPPMGFDPSLQVHLEGQPTGIGIDGTWHPYVENQRKTLKDLGAKSDSIISISGPIYADPGHNLRPLSVDCQVSGECVDFFYDLDSTLETFLEDLRKQEPPMGFELSEDPLGRVYFDGQYVDFKDNLSASLFQLGARPNSVIGIGIRPWFPPSSGLKNKRASTTLTNKRARKPIAKRAYVGLISVDIDALSDFEVVKLAALNSFNESLSRGDAQQRIGELKSWLRRLKSKGRVRTKIPEQFQDKSVETAIGELPFKNFVLWCTATDTLPDGALHTLLNAESLGEDSPSGDVVNLLGKPCQKSNCRGIIRLWDYASTPPK